MGCARLSQLENVHFHTNFFDPQSKPDCDWPGFGVRSGFTSGLCMQDASQCVHRLRFVPNLCRPG